ncbi:DNA primase [Candidatus Saccharibacteria bacterium]|nr:DNA primase [Candidatus Saccharibacteria bacterium]MCB9834697.1 DNA primase [Candidatus Nomurabacteria bacterium]
MSQAVEQVKSRLDLVEFLARYLSLKKAGSSYKGLSPFNPEKTPSFVVNPDKGVWYDFSAGFGGDIFDFVMRIEGVDFYQALKQLAEIAGVEIEPTLISKGKQVNKKLLYELNQLARNFYQHRLLKTDQALEYLKQRGINRQAIIDFGIGYAPASGQELYKFLLAKGYKSEDLLEVSLVGKSSRGYYDFFRDRITLPVNDLQGRVIGFSARLIKPKDGVGKYINTSNNPIYQKSEAIYGIVQAREEIKREDQVIVVEGNLDVISLSQAGVKNVVAGSGTAVGRGQIKLLSRYTSNITLCFDGDRAGREATDKLIKAVFDLELNLKIVFMPDGEDPDSLVGQGLEAWQKVVDQAVSLEDYLLKLKPRDFDLADLRSRLSYIKYIFGFLECSKSQSEVESYIQALAKVTRLSRASVLRDFKAYLKGQPPQSNDQEVASAKAEAKAATLEDDLKMLILGYKEIFEDFKTQDLLHLDLDQEWFANIITEDLSDTSKDVNLLILKAQERFVALSMQDAFSQYRFIIAKLFDQWYDQQLSELRSSLNQAELEGDQARSHQLLETYQKLLKEKNERRQSRSRSNY